MGVRAKGATPVGLILLVNRESAMFSIVHGQSLGIMLREGATLLLAFAIAELFYKFHSFSLECVAFLATWYVFGAVAHVITRAVTGKQMVRR